LIILLLSGKLDQYYIKSFKKDMRTKGIKVIEVAVPQKKITTTKKNKKQENNSKKENKN